MKKVTIKINKVDLQGLLYEIEQILQSPVRYGYQNEDNDNLILSALTELYYKLHSSIDIFKETYKIKISVVQAMALTVHFRGMPDASVSEQMKLTINTVIGTIDQQTK